MQRKTSPESNREKTLAKKTGNSKKAVVGKKPTAKRVVKSSKKKTEEEVTEGEVNLLVNSEKKRNKPVKRRVKKATTIQTLGLTEAVIEGMRERKANSITVMNLTSIETRVTDYFVIADAESSTHVNSIADSVLESVEKLTKDKVFHVEGQQNAEWILIDYINVVVHIFLREERLRFNLEGLWGDADITYIND